MHPIWILVGLCLIIVVVRLLEMLARHGKLGRKAQHVVLLSDYLVSRR